MKPKQKNIDWNKNDGWSKTEQVGYNKAIAEYEAYHEQEMGKVREAAKYQEHDLYRQASITIEQSKEIRILKAQLKEAKEGLPSEEDISNAVFTIMLEKEEYRILPDYYAKEICKEVIHKLFNTKRIGKESYDK